MNNPNTTRNKNINIRTSFINNKLERNNTSSSSQYIYIIKIDLIILHTLIIIIINIVPINIKAINLIILLLIQIKRI